MIKKQRNGAVPLKILGSNFSLLNTFLVVNVFVLDYRTCNYKIVFSNLICEQNFYLDCKNEEKKKAKKNPNP